MIKLWWTIGKVFLCFPHRAVTLPSPASWAMCTTWRSVERRSQSLRRCCWIAPTVGKHTNLRLVWSTTLNQSMHLWVTFHWNEINSNPVPLLYFKDLNCIKLIPMIHSPFYPDTPEDWGGRGPEGPEGGQPREDSERQGAASVGPGGKLPSGWNRQQWAAQRLAQEEVSVRPGAWWQKGKRRLSRMTYEGVLWI